MAASWRRAGSALMREAGGNVLVHGNQGIEIRRIAIHLALDGQSDGDDGGAEFLRQRIERIAHQIGYRNPETAIIGDGVDPRSRPRIPSRPQSTDCAAEDVGLLHALAAT